jgi:hypothetical protein
MRKLKLCSGDNDLKKLAIRPRVWQSNCMITIERTDITDEVRENLVSLTLTDNAKQSVLTSFAVTSETLVLPPEGVKVCISPEFSQ